MSLLEMLFGTVKPPKQAPTWVTWSVPVDRAVELSEQGVRARAELIDVKVLLDSVEEALADGRSPIVVLGLIRGRRKGHHRVL